MSGTSRLSFRDTTGTVTQAHIHLGRTAVNGGIIAFLCSNLPDPPAGTPACPAEGEVTGTITPAGIIGPSGEGIAAGEFDELVTAIRAGAAYVNVHTTTFPGGEIRGQIVVPEPSTLAGIALGLAALSARGWRRAR